MPEKITEARIGELRGQEIPHLDLAAVTATGGNEAEREAVIAHFGEKVAVFADPGEKGTCLNCRLPQSGLLGFFEWAIIHGEGRCAECGWPARAIHYVKLPDGSERGIRAVLQYHPDDVTVRKR